LALCASSQGDFFLRIEDTDEVRSTDESVNGILESMAWLALTGDEGPTTDGKGILDSSDPISKCSGS